MSRAPLGAVAHVLGGQKRQPPPIWLMRQAGRYLPEYRAVRAEAGSFLDLCYDAEKATEVTLQPIRRFDMDAAILFSDILVIPHAMGRDVRFVQGEGPQLDPIDVAGIDGLRWDEALSHLSPVLETVGRVRQALADDKTLIGFCGAPWTVATYMIAGHGTPDQAPARLFAYREEAAFQRLIDALTDVSITYLTAQIRAGADVVQVFDSWSGVLGEEAFHRWCVTPMRKIVEGVRAVSSSTPIIGFPKGANLHLETYVHETGVDGLSIDWTVPVEFARGRLQPHVAVQGNLDPLALIAGGDALDREVDRVLDGLSSGRHIFNLGHGIRPDTPIAHVERLMERVRAYGGEAS